MDTITLERVNNLYLNQDSHPSDDEPEDNVNWKLTDLRKQFQIRGMEKYYERYQQRLQHVQFVVYLMLQSAISISSVVAAFVYINNSHVSFQCCFHCHYCIVLLSLHRH
jgi:hypothetical protein